MLRVQHLVDLIDLHRPQVITEVGFAKGATAQMMIGRASRYQREIEYHGFDLFEEGYTDDIIRREFQGKRPTAYEKACAHMRALAERLHDEGITLRWFLHRGPTTETLHTDAAAKARVADLVYLDGGHSYQTILHDYEALQQSKIIVFDDFYHDRPPEFTARWGCNAVLEQRLHNKFAFLPIQERVPAADGGTIVVGHAITPRSAWPWTRLLPALTMVRHHKPKRVFAYCDEIPMRYLSAVVRDHQGEIVDDHTLQSDLSYVDCVRMLPNGEHLFMNEDEALDAFSKTNAPMQVWAGLRRDNMLGCGSILRALQEQKDRTAIIITGLDDFEGEEVAAFVTPANVWPQPKQSVHVATRNCVDDAVIQANIQGNVGRITKWVDLCRPHDERAIFVSAGPSLQTQIDEIREVASRGGRVVCVKHAHDTLIQNGIVPWACVLLDPRDHVSQFIQNPHPDCTYLVASMVSTTTLDLLLEKNARVVGYHALVGAGEQEILPKGTRFLVGGTSAATRGIPVLLCLGFRRFTLFAYDSCLTERPEDVDEKTKLGYNRFMKVELGGRKFWTELELIAQAQDFRAFLEDLSKNELVSAVELDVRGDGLIPHLWSLMRPVRPSFTDMERSWCSK